MPHPFHFFSQSDYLIQITDINSHTECQTVQIQISWLLQKPTDLDLHYLQGQGISRFNRTRVKFSHRQCTIVIAPDKVIIEVNFVIFYQDVWPASVAQLDAPSDWRLGGRGFNPRQGRQYSFMEIDHEIFSTGILSLRLIQERQLSVSGERMCTILVNRLEN